MKILITGGAGFIGSRLIHALKLKGHTVTAISHQNKIHESDIEIIKGDITDSALAIPDLNYDIIYHLAAVTPLEKNKKIQRKMNFDGTINFFEKIKNKTKCLVYVSGLGVFGEGSNKIVTEETPLRPNTDYAKIRLDTQEFLEENCKKKSIALIVAYLGEVYGNGGWFTDQIIERLTKGKFRMPKSGEYYRNFIHVDDVVSALIAIGEANPKSDSYIITDSNPALLKDFINYTCDLLSIKHPGGVPIFLAKTVMGGDLVKLMTTSIKASNQKISKIFQIKYPSYKEGLDNVISEMKQTL